MYHVLPTLSYQSRVHAIARTSIILFGVEGLVEVDNVLNRLSHFKKKLISRLVKIDFTLYKLTYPSCSYRILVVLYDPLPQLAGPTEV